jgi:hypothetical protein
VWHSELPVECFNALLEYLALIYVEVALIISLNSVIAYLLASQASQASRRSPTQLSIPVRAARSLVESDLPSGTGDTPEIP